MSRYWGLPAVVGPAFGVLSPDVVAVDGHLSLLLFAWAFFFCLLFDDDKMLLIPEEGNVSLFRCSSESMACASANNPPF